LWINELIERAHVGKVLAFRKKEAITCSNCFQQRKQGGNDTVWNFRVPLGTDYSLNVTMYQSGWSKNQTVNTIRFGKEEKHVVNDIFYLCPDCNELFLR
jgi:hypothetical protein